LLGTFPFLPVPVGAAPLLWGDQFGSEKNDVAWSVAADSSVIFVCGATEGTLPGQITSGETDAFVRAYATNGAEAWTKQFGTRSTDVCYGLAADPAGAVAVGRTFGKLPGQRRRGGADAFVRTFAADGGRRWTRQFGSRGNDAAFGVAVDPDGNIYVVGYALGRLSGERYRGNGDAFIRKMAPSGRVLWTKEFGSRGADLAFAVVADAEGVYVAGATTGALPGQRNRGETDLFVVAFAAGGRTRWIREIGTDREDYAYGIALDPGGLYVTGYTKGKFIGQGVGGADALLARFTLEGRRRFVLQFGTDRSDLGSSIAVESGLVYIVGATDGAFEGFVNRGERDVFARAFDRTGVEVWTQQFGSSAKDVGTWVSVLGGVLYVVGQTEGALLGGTLAGGRDAFVAAVG
jgi:hypothetical protein